jgi:ribonuclease J
MYFKIHRGTKEIGGSCVEVWTENTRILLDFGMPLVEKDGKEFNFNKYKALKAEELVELGVLPDIDGLYDGSDNFIDGVVISHAHQDHYGLINYINKKVKHYLGEATHKIIEISNVFMSQKIFITNPTYFEKEIPFQIGDFTITPYWADHSAFDSYSFLVESKRKSIFYSGDFRKHGRKTNAFKWFTHNAPQNVDYLLLEGTTIGRESEPFKSETKIERELIDVFKQQGKINLIYTSGQNIDRLVSIYKACNKTGKTLVVDVYIAAILNALYPFAHIQHPSKEFKNLKVMFPYYTSQRLKETGNKNILYQFKEFKIIKEEIGIQKDKIVMVVRPSMQKDLEKIEGIEGGNLVYSMWKGYLDKPDTKKFIDYLTSRQFSLVKIHTSGHADKETLKEMVDAIKPKNIVPIHTFHGSIYKKIFSTPVVELKDGEIKQV